MKMGIVDSARDLYFHLEDRYYRLIDRINSRILYKIVDKIDSVVPSFALLLLVVFVLIALGLMFVLTQGPLPTATSELVVMVKDQQGNPLKGIGVDLEAGTIKKFLLTAEDGKTEKIKIPLGSRVYISIEKEGYSPKPFEGSFVLNKPVFEKVVELVEEKAFEYVKFKIMDEKLFQPIDRAWIEFQCSNEDAENPAGIFSENGTVEVAVPKNCGHLKVNVSAAGYEKKLSEEVTNNGTIFLSEAEDERGKIIVSLKSHGELITGEELTVYLYKDTGSADGIRVDSQNTTTGQVEFTVSPGKYFVRSLATQRFSVKESLPFDLEAKGTVRTELELEERVIGSIKVRVIDERTNRPVKNAGVTFKKGNQQVFYKETPQNGVVEFNIHEDIGYILIVNHEDYCIQRLENVRKSNEIIEVKIKKYTGDCGGILLARVIDETGRGIEHATVGLYDEHGYAVGFKNLLTDINGEAEFKGVETGTYMVFAFKGSVSGWSDKKKFIRRESQKVVYNVSMTIPNGKLRVRVLDDEMQPLPFADVALKRAVNNKLLKGPMPVQDENGWIEFTEKAGEEVFVVVSKDGYTDYTSSSVKIPANSTKEIEVMLEPKIISGEMKAKFLGLFKGNQKATILGAGQEYTAKFQIRIPENKDYKFIGLHVRTGKENTMEKDMVFIKGYNAPAAPIISKGTSYNPDEGFDFDSRFKTADGAKWINFKWGKFNSGKFDVEVKIKVKDITKQGQQVPIYWRAWAETDNGEIVRDPEDNSLGSTETERELYANTDVKLFQVGIETLCTDKWCFAGSILDIEDEIMQPVSDSFGAIVGKQYKLSFKILNDSPFESDIFDNAKIRVLTKDSAILIGEYQIIGPQGDKIEGNANSSILDWVEIGDLTPSKDVSGTIYFTPKSAISSSLLIQVHSRYSIVFEKEIVIDSAAANELSVKFKKDGEYVEDIGLLPSGVEQTLTVKVLDKASELEIEGASVKVVDRFGSVLGNETTTFFGIADVIMPVLTPGEKLSLVVQKANYMPFEKTLSVDDQILEVEPSNLNITLNAQTSPEKSLNVLLRNKTSLDLKIELLDVTGDFEGLIDTEKTGQWLYSEYAGENIPANSSKNISLKMFLTDFGKSVKETKTLKGKFTARVFSSGKTWIIERPLSVVIGLGGEVDDTACFSLSKHSWKDATEVSPRNADVTISNNCTVNGKPIELQDLSAKIEWNSNHLGEFKIGIKGENSLEIRPGFFKIIRKSIGKEESLPALLSFIPDGGNFGTAKATIVVQAKNPTASGEQLLQDSIDVEITVVSLDSCLRFSKDLIKLKPNEEGSFEISTGDCGGKVDLRIISELNVGSKEITMGSNDSHTVTVLSEERIPGQYPIYVKFRAAGKNEFEVAKLIRVLIEPTEGCIKLNRYEYDIYDDPNNPYDGFDVGKIINSCPSKRVSGTVKFNEKNLCKAIRSGFVTGIIGLVYGGMQAVSLGRPFYAIGPSCEEKGGIKCPKGYECSEPLISASNTSRCCKGTCTKIETETPATSTNTANTSNPSNETVNEPAIEPSPSPETSSEEASPATGTGGSEVIPPSENPTDQNEGSNELLTCSEMGGVPCDAGQCEKKTCGQTCTWSVIPMVKALDTDNCCVGGTCVPTGIMAKERPVFGSRTGLMAFAGIDVGSVLGPLAESLGNIINVDNMWEGLLVGWVAGSAYNYLVVQNAGTITFDVVADDLAITALRILYPSGREDRDAPGISIEMGNEKTEKTEGLEFGRKETEIIFQNSGGVTQENPVSPIYRILKVEGERRDYETSYAPGGSEEISNVWDVLNSLWDAVNVFDNCEETGYSQEEAESFAADGSNLTVKSADKYFQKFHLQFNSYKPEEPEPVNIPGESCKIGTRIGKTGAEAMPKILLKWNWNAISMDTCDEGAGETYCDATQFSIELLKKIHRIDELLAGKTFTCPSESGVLEDVSQALSDREEDVAITRVKVEKDGKKAKVIATIESNNNKEMQVETIIQLVKESDGSVVECPDGVLSIDLISRSTAECSFENLEEGLYSVNVSINPLLNTCTEECKNLDTGNDSLNAKLNVGSSSNVFRVCEPYSTSRLSDFLKANPGNAALEEAMKLSNFKALLIRDGYTKDFRNDFDEFCENDFFGTPAYYSTEGGGLSQYFTNNDLMSFKSYFIERNNFIPEGKYQVNIDIVYKDDSWSLFREGEPNATIEVELSRLDTPRPNSPFYYMPFDGLVGVKTENGRQGYGVNFREESPATLKINNDPSQLIYSSTIAHSSPVQGGWVYTNRIDDFRTLNNTRRGVILDVVRNPDLEETTINLSPSKATPIILKVSGGKSDKAFAFYSVTVDGEPQQVGSYLTTWTGIGKHCYDFEDNEMTETYQETPDLHGGVGMTECAGSFSTSSYGLEWCNIKRKGNVFLKTMFFTPLESESILKAVEGMDSMSFISPSSNATNQVYLNGIVSQNIESIESILQLVEAGEVCVTGYGNEVRTTFFWNPEKVLENTLGETMESVPQQCIAPFTEE